DVIAVGGAPTPRRAAGQPRQGSLRARQAGDPCRVPLIRQAPARRAGAGGAEAQRPAELPQPVSDEVGRQPAPAGQVAAGEARRVPADDPPVDELDEAAGGRRG
ncbi:MAG: hypothetical protein NZQ09_17330, partial [Chloroflexus sp.]|nr:hypothetical protein [Chloroflexus sp.]